MRTPRASSRIQIPRSLSCPRRGRPPPARAPVTSARTMALRNIVRGEHWPRGGHLLCGESGRSRLGRRLVAWVGRAKHGGQLVLAVRRAVQDVARQVDQDGHDLRVELDAGELLQLADSLL